MHKEAGRITLAVELYVFVLAVIFGAAGYVLFGMTELPAALKWGIAFHGVLSLEAEIEKNNLAPSPEIYRMWQDIRTADKKERP